MKESELNRACSTHEGDEDIYKNFISTVSRN
jgi:hypothetical protein